jgi:hypothetical protein
VRPRRFSSIRALAAVPLCTAACAVAALAPAAAQALPKLTECQHPLVTGEEAYNLKNVTATAACPLVRALAHWEYHPYTHITKLYTCIGPMKRTPKLVLRSFDGWKLSITRVGNFQMSRGSSSFDVTGTDFPLNCT